MEVCCVSPSFSPYSRAIPATGLRVTDPESPLRTPLLVALVGHDDSGRRMRYAFDRIYEKGFCR